ncbi:MAG: ABC transporter ATP-binding protein [Promethearchaeota archaeon]
MIIKIPSSNIAISFKDFSFIYGEDKIEEPSISNINFDLIEGETLILAGPSGSGKSTISYAMNGIIPWRQKGFAKGDVQIFGKSIWDYDFSALSKIVGLVKQNPLEQLVTFTVRDEVSFGLENLKIPKDEINSRIKKISRIMGITDILNRPIEQLSGGQKQLTILCSFLVMNPKILILDEPIAFLDQQSESFLLNRLKSLVKSKEIPITLIIIEHRLSRVLDIADKIIVLDATGKISLNGNVKDILQNHFTQLKRCNVRVPWLIDVFDQFEKKIKEEKDLHSSMNYQFYFDYVSRLKQDELKILQKIIINKEINTEELKKYETLDQIIDLNETYAKSLKLEKFTDKNDEILNNNNILFETKDLCFSYPNSGIRALNNIAIQIQKGDFIGLVGPNGSGKTTLLYLLANLYQPSSGSIYFKNQLLDDIDSYKYAQKVGFIFQNPENMIFNSSIKDEILYGPKNFGILSHIKEEYFQKLIDMIGKEDPLKNPFNLSWGQKRRLNLSSIFIYDPDIILLDEPFIGQDQKTIEALVETLYIENRRGKTIIISSHDYHLLLKYTKRIIELDKKGTVQYYDTKSNYFSSHSNLGPILLLNEIHRRLEEGNV